MVPFFGWALLLDNGESITWRLVAFALFAGAMITDKIDGDLARKHNLVTNFGKIADPIADKALTGMAFIGLSIIGEIWWWVTILVLVREWSVTLMRLSIAKHVVLAANQSGKLKTMLQALALSLLDVEPRLARSTYRPEELKAAIANGKKYLVAEQKADGSWPETTRPADQESYAQRISTTGWAMLALLSGS